MNGYRVALNSMNEYSKEMKKRINEISDEIKLINDLKKDLVWQGIAYDSSIKVFNDEIKKISVIPDVLNLYMSFFDITY